ncbi:MAG: hypothetical protein NTV25_04275 [Methanothrix sp.]|nr:hypothetical protein [Methanothrix sp.]
MRRQLVPFLAGRYRFAATVEKFGLLYGPSKATAPSMLLCDVALHTGSLIVVSQHCWTPVSPEVAELNPKRWDRICFDATVCEYYKFNGLGIELLDYSIGQLANIDLVAGGGNGQSLAEYLNNLRQSRTFAQNQIEIPCTA